MATNLPSPAPGKIAGAPVSIEVAGKRKTFTGDFATFLAYLYRHAEIFQDPETVGNFIFSLKGGHIAHRFDDAIISPQP